MKKKTIAIVIAALAILIGAALIIGMQDDEGKENNMPDTTATADETANADEETGQNDDSLEVSAGVEDSIFDDDTEDTSDAGNDAVESETQDQNEDGDKENQQGDDKEEAPAVDVDSIEPGELDYESFHAMDPADQQKYMESFNDIDAFFDWYNDVKKQYEKDHPSIEINGDTEIDLDELN